MKWAFEAFGGLRPRFSSRLLPDNAATVAENTRLEDGNLTGWRAPSTVVALARTGPNISIWHMDTIDRWLHWTTDVDVAKSPVEGDVDERTYYTGDGVPKLTTNDLVDVGGNDQYPESSYPLAVSNPTVRPTVGTGSLAESGTVTAGMSAGQAQVSFVATDFDSVEDEIRRVGGDQNFEAAGFIAGLTVRVLAVASANTFTIESNSGAGAICDVAALDSWTVSNSAKAVTGTLQIPNGITVTQTAHGLRAGDVLTITAVVTPLTCTLRRLQLTGVPGDLITAVKLVTPEDYAAGTSDTFDLAGEFTYSVYRDVDNVTTRSYVYTYVTNLGEESAPSPPSDPVTVHVDDTVSLSTLANPPSDGRTYSEKRLYRTATGTSSTNFLFVATIAIATTTYSDDKTDVELGEVIYTEGFDNPPATLSGLVSFPGGILAGFYDNVVCLCEPGFPHAWPVEYRRTTDYKVVGLGVFGNSILVTTQGNPYVLTGVHPRSMSMRRIDVMQACVSKRSIQSVGDAVLYASPDGLVSASASGFSVVTRDYLRKEDWQAYYPSTLIGTVFDNQYVGFYYTGTERKCFVFDPSDETRGLINASASAYGTFYDPMTDNLYLSSGTAVLKWDGGADQTYTWRSKQLRAAYPINLGAARVQADTYPVTFKLIDADTDDQIAYRTVTGREPFRLPANRLYNRFYVEVTAPSSYTIERVACAETLDEMLEE